MLVMMAAMWLPQSVNAQVSVWDGTYAPWTNGTGTESDPFLIENAQQLAYLANRVNNGLDAAGGHVSNHDLHYKLMTDVDLNGSEDFQWTPIGYWISGTNYYSFGGHFDGNNHTVSGLYINSSANRVGFFGYTDGAMIENLSVNGDTVATSGNYAGGIVGVAAGVMLIKDCNNGCNVNCDGSNMFSGGIVGYSNSVLTISNSYNSGDVSTNDHSVPSIGDAYSGGIIGRSASSTLIINDCYNTGNIISVGYGYSVSGGIVGYSNSTNISNCYNTGSINAAYYEEYDNPTSGGIVGFCNASNIINSYNVGTSHKTEYYHYIIQGGAVLDTIVFLVKMKTAGIVGSGGATVVNCFYLDTCAANNTYGGSPMSAEIMRTAEFVGMLNNGSCAWEQVVAPMVNDGYPILTMIVEDAYTEPATDLTASSAILHGSIFVDHTTITSKGFEYRAVGDSVYTALNVTGNNEVFSYFLNGLTPNTTYEYRTFVNVAECPYTSYGATQTFEVSWLNADTIYIYNAGMLQWVSDRCNSGTDFAGKYIKLMNNIVLPLNQPNNMSSIGRYPNYPFRGTFDGNGLTITNLYIDQPNTEYQGFFGYTQNAYLYEVGLVNITASGRNYTGGMVAYAQNTYMRDCYVNGGTLFALSYCGGLVGYQQQGTNSIISGCYNTCTVSGNHYVGGLVGFSNYSTVRNSYVAASVAGQGNGVGAIIGGANDVLMYNCYFSSTITGQSSAIGENNFKDGEGLSDEEMRDPAFVATLNQGLVTPVWKSDYAAPINNGFPILIWQYSDAEACEAPANLTSTVSGNSVILNWTGGENANYFIVEYGKVGEEPQQENTPNATFTIHNVQEGNYFWRVKSVCSFGESNFVNGENITTGVNEWGDGHFTVYPNPTTGMVNVRLDENGATWNVAEIQMFDVYGRLLNTVETCHGASLQTTQIDLSSYAPGIYLIKLVGDGRVIGVRKVVKR